MNINVPAIGPEVALENQAAVYDFVGSQEISKPIARFAHFVFRWAYKPEIEYIGDAEQQIQDHFGEDKTAILASTHGLLDDPFVLASIAGREEALRPLIGNTVIPAKEAIFNMVKEKKWLHKAMRLVLDNFIALPTFRERDYPLDEMPDDEREQTEELLSSARVAVIDECVDRLDDGNNVAIFPEAHRGDDPDRVQKIKTGIARMALKSVHKEDLVIIPVSIRYIHEKIIRKEGESKLAFNLRQAKNLLRRRKPKVVIGEIFEVADDQEEILHMVKDSLQKCVDKTKQMAA